MKDRTGNLHFIIRKDETRKIWVIDEGIMGVTHRFIWGIEQESKNQVFILINLLTQEEKIFGHLEVGGMGSFLRGIQNNIENT